MDMMQMTAGFQPLEMSGRDCGSGAEEGLRPLLRSRRPPDGRITGVEAGGSSFTPAPIFQPVAATTLQAVEDLLAEFSYLQGFASWLLCARINAEDTKYAPRALTNRDPRFVEEYNRNGWGAVDLILRRGFESSTAYIFEPDDFNGVQNEWTTALRDEGLDYGLCVPFHGPNRQTLVLVLTDPTYRLTSASAQTVATAGLVFMQRIYTVLETLFGLKARVDLLTDRELQILTLIAHGKPIKVIADLLHLSHKSVSNYIAAICLKLRVATRDEAVAVAAAHHIVSVVSRGSEYLSILGL